MLRTKLGTFNGTTWENLCQLVFKKKYGDVGYQEMPASPGDFGLEGFTLQTGVGFQCYCPDTHYGPTELYEFQRDKITTDLKKLQNYAKEIGERIGLMKLREWHFVTPEIDRNKLLAHARTKEEEVRGWNVPILAPDFTVYLRDADFFITEINEIQTLNGQALNFDTTTPSLDDPSGPVEEYEANMRRKTAMRLAAKIDHPQYQRLFATILQQTQSTFLEHGSFLKQIERTAPTVYFKLIRIVSEFEKSVLEWNATWTGTAEELVCKVREGLAERIATSLGPQVDQTEAQRIARHIVARWLAVCELDFFD